MQPVPERPDPAIRRPTTVGSDTTHGDQRGVKRIAPKIGQDQSDRRGSRGGRAYVPMETAASGVSDQPQNGNRVRKDWRKSGFIYLLAAVAIAVIAGGGYYAGQHQPSVATTAAQVLMLSYAA